VTGESGYGFSGRRNLQDMLHDVRIVYVVLDLHPLALQQLMLQTLYCCVGNAGEEKAVLDAQQHVTICFVPCCALLCRQCWRGEG
jgi:hypothetical protein